MASSGASELVRELASAAARKDHEAAAELSARIVDMGQAAIAPIISKLAEPDLICDQTASLCLLMVLKEIIRKNRGNPVVKELLREIAAVAGGQETRTGKALSIAQKRVRERQEYFAELRKHIPSFRDMKPASTAKIAQKASANRLRLN